MTSHLFKMAGQEKFIAETGKIYLHIFVLFCTN